MENNWVADQMSLLDPPASWQIDSVAARDRFHARATTFARPRPRWAPWAVAAALLCTAVAGQQFWQYLTVPHVAFIHVNSWPEGMPSPAVNLIGRPLPPIPAGDLDQARWRVHYDPRLPRYGVLSGSPRLSTVFPLAAGTVVHTGDLQRALEKTGIAASVPREWDGAQLALHTSHIVLAEWPDAVLAQSLPLTLTAPSNFDFAAYSTLCLRIVGVSPDEAQRLAQRAGTTPAWLAPIDRGFEEASNLEEVKLHTGPATLVIRHSSVTIVWSVPDRVYLLHGKISRELAIAAADSVQ